VGLSICMLICWTDTIFDFTSPRSAIPALAELLSVLETELDTDQMHPLVGSGQIHCQIVLTNM